MQLLIWLVYVYILLCFIFVPLLVFSLSLQKNQFFKKIFHFIFYIGFFLPTLVLTRASNIHHYLISVCLESILYHFMLHTFHLAFHRFHFLILTSYLLLCVLSSYSLPHKFNNFRKILFTISPSFFLQCIKPSVVFYGSYEKTKTWHVIFIHLITTCCAPHSFL